MAGAREPARPWPLLDEVVAALETTRKAELPRLVAGWLDTLDATGRWALLKLVTGGLRVGASARLAKLALAEYGAPGAGRDRGGLARPGAALRARCSPGWTARARDPRRTRRRCSGPLMLAHPVEGEDVAKVAADLDSYLAEWKWDGIRVQIAATSGGVRLYSRSGDDISNTFPDLVEAVAFRGRARRRTAGQARGRGRLVQRAAAAPEPQGGDAAACSRTTRPSCISTTSCSTGTRICAPCPSPSGGRGWRRSSPASGPPRMDVSPLVEVAGLDDLERLRGGVRGTPIEGLMLKRKDSPYLAGRPKG